MGKEDHRFDMNKRRTDDKLKESLSSDFFEKFVYPYFGIKTKSVDDKELQIAGVDKIFDYKGKTYYCDEKAATRNCYWDKSLDDYRPLMTFCMECRQKARNGKYIDGWFLNPNKKTNAYLLMWIDDAVPSKDNPEVWDRINEATCVLVSSDKVIRYLENKGIDRERIESICEELEETSTPKFESGVKFSHLLNYGESPTNFYLKRNQYVDMADFAVRVMADNGKVRIKDLK